MFKKTAGFLCLFAGVFTAAAAGITLDVNFDQKKTVKINGSDVVLDGTFKKLKDGDPVMAFGKKVYRFPAQKLVTEQGTLVLDFATEKMRNSKSSARTLLYLRSNSRLLIGFSTYRTNPYIQFVFTDQTHNFSFSPSQKLKPEQLYQVAMSWDGDKVRCYQDGLLVKEVAQPIKLDVKRLTTLNLGPHKDNWYGVLPWDDDTLVRRIRVYDYALSSTEIQKLSAKKMDPVHKRYPRVIVVPKRTGKITADANLNDPGWRNSASPVELAARDGNGGKTWEIPMNHTYFTWDEKNLYLGFDTVFPQDSVIKKGHGPKDKESGVWGVESFELHLRHHGQAYYFGGCVGGGINDIKNNDSTYNPKWQYVSHLSHRIDDTLLWQAEAVIPWTAIELKAPPKELKLNFVRSWFSSKVSASSDLADQKEKGYWADNDHFYTMKFDNAAPSMRLLERNDPSYGEIVQKVELNAAKNTTVELKVIQDDSLGRVLPQILYSRKFQLKAGIPVKTEIQAQLTSEQATRLIYELNDLSGRKTVLRQDLPIKLKFVYLTVSSRFNAEYLSVNVKNEILKKKFGKDFQGALVLTGPNKRKYQTIAVSAKQPQNIAFPKSNPKGVYRLDLLNKKTGKAVSGCQINFPGFGPWSQMKFDTTRIIPPYTPLETSAVPNHLTVNPIGRSYSWTNNGLMPEKIVSQGCNLLAAPSELRINNKAVPVRLKTELNKPHRVEFSGTGKTAQVQVASKSWIEYDGVLYNTVELTALQNTGKVELRFAIPRKQAKYLHTSQATWGNKLTMALPNGKFECKYYPVVFIGNETKGLCFFAESDSTWRSRDSKPLKFVSDSKETVFTVLLADKLSAGQKLNFEFGLLAAPVKPLPRNCPLNTSGWGYLIPMNRPGKVPTTWCSFIPISPILSDCFADLPEENNSPAGLQMKKDAERAIKFNVKPYSYNLACFMTDEYPEVRAFLDEWQMLPQQIWHGKRNGKDYTLRVLCPAGDGVDFYLYKVQQLLKKVPLHGLNFDFGIIPSCSNPLHGCHNRTPIIAYREFYRKIALLFLDAGIKDYVFQIHNTDSVQLPAYTFVTHLSNGEHIRQQSSTLMHNGKDILDTYQLPMFAFELTTLPYGVTSIPYQANDVLTKENGGGKEDPELYKLRITRAFLTGTLIHNTINGLNRCHYGIFDKIVRIYDKFKVPECEFIGYWDERGAAKVTNGKDVYVSLYRAPKGNRILAVISHIGNKRLTQDVTIRFNPQVLKMQNFRKAIEHIDADDPEYQELYDIRAKYKVPSHRAPLKWTPAGVKVLDFRNNTLKLHLPYHTFALVELQ